MTTTSPEPWVSTEAVADYLGKNASWIHQNAERVGLPRRRLGNQWRYRLSEVDAWLDARTTAAVNL